MLIQFTVANYRSFRGAQTLSMAAAGNLKRLKDKNTFAAPIGEQKLPNLLRCVSIFGANASGKSNLVRALGFVEQLVMNSASAKPDSKIDVQPFKLNKESAAADSQFEIEFIEEGVRYQFGFTANVERITSEWLLSYATSRATELYRRKFDADLKQDVYIFGRAMEGGRLRRDWAAQTGPATLYLSRVVQASSQEFEQLRRPFRWFSRRLRIERHLNDELAIDQFTSTYCETEEKRQKVVDFLRGFDIPVVDIRIQQRKLDAERFTSIFKPDFMDQLKIGEDFLAREPRFIHQSDDGEMIEFRSSDESDGTMSLYGFAAKWLEVIENNYVLIVDELDSSLHPLAVWELIRKLVETKSHAQLIFTTHDVTVLRSKLLRRDQVYFTSTNKHRESQLYSLLDFKGREDDAFEDRYLQGRYGATPVLTR